eukprot:6197769-Pleurochrysis_carterae.AAC.1
MKTHSRQIAREETAAWNQRRVTGRAMLILVVEAKKRERKIWRDLVERTRGRREDEFGGWSSNVKKRM